MKPLVKTLFLIMAWLALFAIQSVVFCEQLTSEQKNVWKSVEKHMELFDKKDLEGFLAYIHPEFMGFTHTTPLPIDKAYLEKWTAYWLQDTKIIVHDPRPVRNKN